MITSLQQFLRGERRPICSSRNPLFRAYEEQIMAYFHKGGNLQEKLDNMIDINWSVKDKIVTGLICRAMQSYEFLEYSSKERYKNINRQEMMEVARKLRQLGCISGHNYEVIRQKFQNRGLKHCIVDFLVEYVSEAKKDVSAFVISWERHIVSDFFQVWAYILEWSITNKIILAFAECCHIMLQYIPQPYDQLKKRVYVGIQQLCDYLHQQQQYGRKKFDVLQYKAQKLHKQLKEKVINNSVFLSETKVAGAKAQINEVMALLRGSQQDFRSRLQFEYFQFILIGSYQNGLALQYQSNIDFVLRIDDRGRKLNPELVLGILSDSITRRCFGARGVQYLIEVESGLVPYLRIRYKNMSPQDIRRKNYYATGFHIYVNDLNSVQSSSIIELCNRGIVGDLCLLVKLWVRRRYLGDNRGMSGYVVSVMVIYYLMKTGQIGEVVLNEETEQYELVGKQGTELSNNLFENFREWMKFYAAIGNQQGHYELSLISVIKKNVYNPCRLRVKLVGQFNAMINHALQIMKTYGSVEQLFKFPKI